MKFQPKPDSVKKPCLPNYPLKKRRISSTLIVCRSNETIIKIIKGDDEDHLKKIAKDFLKEKTPKGETSMGSLWRKGKIFGKVSFSNKNK